MPFHALPRTAAFKVEATFAETVDFAADGLQIYVIEPDVGSFERAMLPSENIMERRLNPHLLIPGLKSGTTLGLSIYMTAAGVNAAEAAQAAPTNETTLMKAALGGRSLGWSIGLDGAGSVSAPGIDADPGFAIGDWVYFWNASTSTGTFHRIENIVGLVLTVMPDLPEAPDVADIFHAVIAIYPDSGALDNHADANHDTLGWYIKGDAPGDVYVGEGCKPSMEIADITAGEPVKVVFDHMVTTWPVTPAAVTLPGTPSGIAPTTPSTGNTASVLLSDFGQPLAAVACLGTITPTFGITWEAVTGVCGTEGVKGYIAAGVGEGGPTLTVEYDTTLDDDFELGTQKHMLVQIGNGQLDAWGIYWPRLEFRAAPVRTDEGSVTSHALDFHALEDTADTTGLTGDDLEQRRAPFIVLVVA
jgi:hypothetical protein